jgi:hypothetical protein
MTRRATGLAVVGLLLLAGCGQSPGYDAAAVESYLATSQAATFAPTAQVSRAACPSDQELREGMTFTCTLSVSGSKLPYRVTLTHVHDTVEVAAAPAGVIVSGAKLRAFVRTTLPKDSAGAQVDCGGPFVVAAVGSTVDCTLELGSQATPMKVKVLDETGRVSITS